MSLLLLFFGEGGGGPVDPGVEIYGTIAFRPVSSAAVLVTQDTQGAILISPD